MQRMRHPYLQSWNIWNWKRLKEMIVKRKELFESWKERVECLCSIIPSIWVRICGYKLATWGSKKEIGDWTQATSKCPSLQKGWGGPLFRQFFFPTSLSSRKKMWEVCLFIKELFTYIPINPNTNSMDMIPASKLDNFFSKTSSDHSIHPPVLLRRRWRLCKPECITWRHNW